MPPWAKLPLPFVLWGCFVSNYVISEPVSKPYIAYRTDPFDQPGLHHTLNLDSPLPSVQQRPYLYDEVSGYQCPLQMTLGVAEGMHVDREDESITTAPVLYPLSHGVGSQVIYTTAYEHLHLLQPGYRERQTTTALKEVLVEPPEFPLLMESSAYMASPVLHDVNADGFLDAILVDYDGGVSVLGLKGTYRHHVQVPRMYVRREWVTGRIQHPEATGHSDTNSSSIHDPFHSYFEYYYDKPGGKDLIRGDSAGLLSQSSADAAALTDRRQAKRQLLQLGRHARRLEEVPPEMMNYANEGYDDVEIPEVQYDDGRTVDDMMRGNEEPEPDEHMMDEVEQYEGEQYDDDPREFYDDHYRNYDDDYHRYYGDDMYSNEHNEYYDTKHYVRITPHVLSTPVHAEVPKLYSTKNEMDDLLFVAVSYYLDEDEFEDLFHYKRFEATDTGQENEVRRGTYVSSAIMAYVLGEYGGRWMGQTHLDLSTDFTSPENATLVAEIPIHADLTQMSAMCLGSPTVADIDGDGVPEVLLGTNMGIVYVLDARNMQQKSHWPVQLPRPVEHRIVVEDVVGKTDLEVFVSDIGGNVICLNHVGEIIWHRNWIKSLQLQVGNVEASSPISLGDINGDGNMDLVQMIVVQKRVLVFAVQASTGADLRRFPMELDGTPDFPIPATDVHQKVAQPLLVDLHADQSFLSDYLRRNGTSWNPVGRRSGPLGRPHGGSGAGLHIVVPAGDEIFVIEGDSGCTHKVSIGEPVSAMVQADDVHGTGKMDLVVATEEGNIITLETQAPFHPLNTWTNGNVRRRGNNHAHGYSATQGIFVHEVSRSLLDVFGVYVPVTFEIFDNRPGAGIEPDRRKYIGKCVSA